MTELEQLKADLATLEATEKIYKRDISISSEILSELILWKKDKIAELETQSVDEWAEAKRAIFKHTQSGGHYVKAVAQYARHLEGRVAKLDHKLRCERADGGKVRDALRARVAESNPATWVVRNKESGKLCYLNVVEPGQSYVFICREAAIKFAGTWGEVEQWKGQS